MDILVAAARKTISTLCTCITTDIPTNTYNTYYTSAFILANDAPKWTANSNTYICWIGDQGQRSMCISPWCTNQWVTIPTMPNGNTSYAGNTGGVEFSGLKVCAANLTSGACCQWTVPAGVTRARFQIWGAGAGALSGCCCGGSTHGTTGAYASIIIPVVAGCQYTLCAGCACAVPIRWTTGSTSSHAAASYVTGYGLCNYCAMGGRGIHHYFILCNDLGINESGYCRWAAPDCTCSSGACICSSGDFCFGGSCSSCGCIPYSFSKPTTYYGCYTGTWSSSNDIEKVWAATVAGIPGLNGSHCFDTGFSGYYYHPPIYGFESVSQCQMAHNTTTSGGILCNHFDYNYMRYPGAGGTAVAVYGGCTIACAPLTTSSVLYCCNATTYCGGDVGRSGMVCVTYC